MVQGVGRTRHKRLLIHSGRMNLKRGVLERVLTFGLSRDSKRKEQTSTLLLPSHSPFSSIGRNSRNSLVPKLYIVLVKDRLLLDKFDALLESLYYLIEARGPTYLFRYICRPVRPPEVILVPSGPTSTYGDLRMRSLQRATMKVIPSVLLTTVFTGLGHLCNGMYSFP